MKLSAYPAYRSSGVDWLGDIPKPWDVTRLRYLADRSDEKIDADENKPLPYIGMENVESWVGKLAPLELNQTAAGIASRFRRNDVLFGKLRPYLAKAWVAEFDGLCSSELLVLRTRQTDSRFLCYQLLSEGFISLVDSSTQGAKMPRADWEFVGSCRLAQPPLTEQRAIADLLDAQTARIDTLVAKKRELIEKLQEKRAALISRTVTRGLPPEAARAAGLDPHPRLQPSGVEWLGDVPEHWGVTRLKHITSKIIDCPHETPVYSGDGGHQVIRTADLFPGQLNLSGAYLVDEDEYLKRVRRGKLLPDDIVYGREGERWGFAALVPTDLEMCLGQRMMQFRAAGHYEPAFLMWHLNSDCVYRQGALDVTGATSPHVNVETIRNYWLTVPPRVEQDAIARYLDCGTARIDNLVGKAEGVIVRLNEYRTALITAAVTGKIDVRGVTAREDQFVPEAIA